MFELEQVSSRESNSPVLRRDTRKFSPVKASQCKKILSAYKSNNAFLLEEQSGTKQGRKTGSVVSRASIKVDKTTNIKNLTMRPKGAVPPGGLSVWNDLTPDVKLPDIRNRSLGKIYYTRGRIGKQLIQHKQEFDVSDPYNRRTVVDSKEYSALHDPHCKAYFKQPSVMKHLKNQNLINEKGEVLCNVHEFNQYRSYLGSLFNNQVKRRIKDSEEIKQMAKDLNKSICSKVEQKKKDLQAYQVRHKLLNAFYIGTRQERYESKIRNWEEKIQHIDIRRMQTQLARTGEYTLKHWNAYLTRQKTNKKENRRKKLSLTRIAYAEIKNEYVTKYDKFVKLALFERYKADQAAVMIARDDQIDDMEQLVEETLKRAKAAWLNKYKNFIDENRDHPRNKLDQRLFEEERRRLLEKKYFDKWRKHVLERKMSFDKDHQTSFHVDKELRPYVAKLRNKANDPDSEVLDDTILDISGKGKKSDKNKSAEEDRSGHHHQHKKHGFGDGLWDLDERNEADLDEADEYIDKVLSKYLLQSDLLQTKLKSDTNDYQPLPAASGRGILINSSLKGGKHLEFDEDQTGLQDAIQFLSDINEVVQQGAEEEFKMMKVKRHVIHQSQHHF